MAAVSLQRYTNMADVKSGENDLLPLGVWSVGTGFHHYTFFYIVATTAALFLFPFLLRIFYVGRTARF